jgi:CheY-like chemotaxis protein
MNSESPTSCKTILLVDDRDDTRVMTRWFLSNFGYIVQAVRNAEEALRVFDPRSHDLVLTDNSMPGMSGLEMSHVLKLRSPSTPILMYCGDPPKPSPAVDLVIQRPTHMLFLKDAIDQLLTETEGPCDQR